MIQKSQFKSAWWLPGGHLQTIFPNLFPRWRRVQTLRERLVLDDGDFIDLDWAGPEDGPLALVLYGLTGTIHSSYIQGLMRSLVKDGWRVVVMNFRGCSGEPNLTARGYNLAQTRDLQYVVERLTKRYPTRTMVGVGFSLGGNLLLKYLGKQGKACPFKMAVAVSVPFSIQETYENLNKGAAKIYQWWFMRDMRRWLKRKSRRVKLPVEFATISSFSTIHEFDQKVTVPLHDFVSYETYYDTASCIPDLKNIAVKTLLLHADNDPMMSNVLRVLQGNLSENLTLEISEAGGHIGFVAGKYPWKPEYWLDRRIAEYLRSLIA